MNVESYLLKLIFNYFLKIKTQWGSQNFCEQSSYFSYSTSQERAMILKLVLLHYTVQYKILSSTYSIIFKTTRFNTAVFFSPPSGQGVGGGATGQTRSLSLLAHNELTPQPTTVFKILLHIPIKKSYLTSSRTGFWGLRDYVISNNRIRAPNYFTYPASSMLPPPTLHSYSWNSTPNTSLFSGLPASKTVGPIYSSLPQHSWSHTVDVEPKGLTCPGVISAWST